MTSKKLLTLGAIIFGMMSLPVLAGKISFQPTYSDPRFAPADMFHAGCMQDAQVSFAGQEKNISKIHLELEYAPEDMEISRIIGADQVIANYRIEYDRIIFDIDNPIITSDTPLFHISFKSKETTASTDIVVATGSYIVSNDKIVYMNEIFPLQFASVPECEPDVVPPSIDVMFPKDPTARIALDQYFVFDLKDSGKGVDKNSIKVYLNNEVYTADSANIKWKGDYMTFYPQNRLDINKKITLKISADDAQVYGGPNTTEKTFTFKTATGMALLDNIDPMTFRTLAREGQKLSATPEECLLLQNVYATSDSGFQAGLVSVLQKMGCEITTEEGTTLFDTTQHGAAPEKNKNLNYISVFAALGRILFVIALVLKFHYMASYKKHKKLANMYRNN